MVPDAQPYPEELVATNDDLHVGEVLVANLLKGLNDTADPGRILKIESSQRMRPARFANISAEE